MKKISIAALSVIGAVLLISSFPLRDIAGNMVSDICRLIGFGMVFVVLWKKNVK